MTEVIIRHSEEADSAQIRDIYIGRTVAAGTLQLPYSSVKTWISRMGNPPSGSYSLVADSAGKIVGHIGFNQFQNPRRAHVGGLGMGVKDSEQHQGIGQLLLAAVIDLADNWLNMTRLELTVYTDNEPAINLYKCNGFIVEGESKNYAFRDGQFVDAFYMARLRQSTE